jgi:lysophospholipase L1-like esterase
VTTSNFFPVKRNIFLKTSLLAGLAALFGFIQRPEKITVYLIGDSTMSIKDKKYYPETGWGMPFAHFFDESVTVDNLAMNGRSTGSFIAENRWQPVVDKLWEGDYVLIQFGHNDEVKTKKTYTTEEEFQANLVRFINETRAKKAQPVLITPVARRSFNEQGELEDTHATYSQLVRKVAEQNKVPLIDLDRKSQALLKEFGVEKSKLLFLQLAPGEHPNYPEGKVDNTHFSELGARKMAQLVLAEIRSLNLSLAERIARPAAK